MAKRFLPLIWPFLVFFLASSVRATTVPELEKWTGQHTRLVWVQDQGDGSDALARGRNLMLYGFDSRDGKGERSLGPVVDNLFKPIFTPDGKFVVVSNRQAREMYLIEWEGGRVERLGAGVAVAVWEDPQPSLFLRKKTTWVYCFTGLQPDNKYGTAQPLYRFPLDNPKKKELVWNSTNMAWSSVQLSRDGKLLGGLFPWPDGGVIFTEKNKLERFGKGCWTSLSPDNSKLFWIFDGLHRNVQIYDVPGKQSWQVNINGAPGINGFEVYHPRWSNHPRYFVMTGPYEKGEGGNKIRGGGEKVEVYIGRFDEKVRSVESWFQLTHNSRADFYPDMWVDGGGNAQLADSVVSAGSVAESVSWPQDTRGLVFLWENMKAGNQLDEKSPIGFYQSNIGLRGGALHSKDFQFSTRNGWGDTGDAGEKIGRALAESKKGSIEITVTPKQEQQGAVFSFLTGKKERVQLQQRGTGLAVTVSEDSKPAGSVAWGDIVQSGKPVSLTLTFDGSTVELFVAGKSYGSRKLAVNLAGANIDDFILGDRSGSWQGSLENIGVYNRVLGHAEIEQNARLVQQALARRKPVATLRLNGSLADMTEIPSPDSIGAYKRALVINSYMVDNVIDGEYQEERILVAEWAVLDRQIIKEYQDSAQPEQLVLQKFSDHPELEGERQMMDIFEPDLEMYYRLPEG